MLIVTKCDISIYVNLSIRIYSLVQHWNRMEKPRKVHPFPLIHNSLSLMSFIHKKNWPRYYVWIAHYYGTNGTLSIENTVIFWWCMSLLETFANLGQYTLADVPKKFLSQNGLYDSPFALADPDFHDSKQMGGGAPKVCGLHPTNTSSVKRSFLIKKGIEPK